MEKMAISKYSPIITDICSIDALHIIDDRGEPPLWPLNVVETLWFLGKFYPKELYECIFALKEKGFARQEIAKLFRFPTRLTDLFHFVEIPVEGLTVVQKEELFEEAVKIAEVFRKDPFCKNGRNEIWSQEKIKEAIKNSNWLEIAPRDKDIVNVLSKLHALMFLYSEFIWVGGRHQLGHELHGPYPLGSGRILFAREYYDLKPAVWPFTNAVPMESFTLLEIYENTSIKLDCYNHLESLESLPQRLKSFAFPGGDYYQAKTIYDGVQRALLKGNEYVENYQKSDWLKKAIEMQTWSIKPLKDVLGMNWYPPTDLLEKAEKIQPVKEIREIVQKIEKIMVLGPESAHEKLTHYFLEKFYTK